MGRRGEYIQVENLCIKESARLMGKLSDIQVSKLPAVLVSYQYIICLFNLDLPNWKFAHAVLVITQVPRC